MLTPPTLRAAMRLPSRAIATLLVAIGFAVVPAAQTYAPAEAAARYTAVDLDAFADDIDGPGAALHRGLRALTRGDDASAEATLREAAGSVPDSLRPFVYDRLAGLAARHFDWAGALRHKGLAASARGEAFDLATDKASVFASAPAPSVHIDGGVASVSFDGYRADGALYGPGGPADARFFFDSGAPVTLLSRSLAERLGLVLDSSAGGAVSIPARGIDGAAVFRTVIDSLRLGGAVFRNIPADVLDTDRPIADGADLFLGFDALSGLLGGVRYGFADSTLTFYERNGAPNLGTSPNMLLEAGYAFLAYEADGGPFTGVIDTGSPFSFVYADWWTPAAGAVARPVTHRGRLADTDYSFTVDYYGLRAVLAGMEVAALPLGLSRRGQVGAPFRVMSLLGTGLFADGALLLDFDRRVATATR